MFIFCIYICVFFFLMDAPRWTPQDGCPKMDTQDGRPSWTPKMDTQDGRPSWTPKMDAHAMTRTFGKEGEGQGQPVQGEGRGVRGVDRQRGAAGQREEQVHGGVLPVHQVLPAAL